MTHVRELQIGAIEYAKLLVTHRLSCSFLALAMVASTTELPTEAQLNPHLAVQRFAPVLRRAATQVTKHAGSGAAARKSVPAAPKVRADTAKSDQIDSSTNASEGKIPGVTPGKVVKIAVCGVVLLTVTARPGEKPEVKIGNMGRKPATVNFAKAGADGQYDSAEWPDRSGALAIKTPVGKGLNIQTGSGLLTVPEDSSLIAYRLNGKSLEVFHLSGSEAKFTGQDKNNQSYTMPFSANQVISVPADASETTSAQDEEWIPAEIGEAEADSIGPIEGHVKVAGKTKPVAVHRLNAQRLADQVKQYDLCALARTLLKQLLNQMQAGGIPGVSGGSGRGGGGGSSGGRMPGAVSSSPVPSDEGSPDPAAGQAAVGDSGNSLAPGNPEILNFDFRASEDGKGGATGFDIPKAWLEDADGNVVRELNVNRSGQGFQFTDTAGSFRAQLSPDQDYRTGTLNISGTDYKYDMQLTPPTGRLNWYLPGAATHAPTSGIDY